MPGSVIDTRVRAAYRAQASAAALACGAATFALGAGLAVPLCLNAAYLAAACAVPASGLAAFAACRLRARGPRPAFLFMMETAAALLLMLAAAALAGQSLLARAAAGFVCALTLGGALLCALCGETGVCRLCFALRWVLPFCLIAPGCAGLPGQGHAGVFPLLGTGAGPLLLGACLCVSACTPALALALPPAALEDAGQKAMACPPPRARFFALRAMAGSGVGALLALLLTLCNGYETLRALGGWGERMLVLSRADPHGGLLQELMTLAQLLALALGAAAMLAGAERAAVRMHPALARGRAGLLLSALVCAAALGASLACGAGPLLLAAPAALAALALLSLAPRGRRHREV